MNHLIGNRARRLAARSAVLQQHRHRIARSVLLRVANQTNKPCVIQSSNRAINRAVAIIINLERRSLRCTGLGPHHHAGRIDDCLRLSVFVTHMIASAVLLLNCLPQSFKCALATMRVQFQIASPTCRTTRNRSDQQLRIANDSAARQCCVGVGCLHGRPRDRTLTDTSDDWNDAIAR